jgi:PUA domain protein
MFKKFHEKDDVIGQNPIKSSVQRTIRSTILKQYPALEPHLEEILPKKKEIVVVKCTNYIELVKVDREILFFKGRDDPYFPALTLVHRCKSV